jgi:hypothetical protein
MIRPCRARVLTLLAALAAASCDCGAGTGDVQPWLDLAEDSLDFGAVALDTTATQTLRLRAGTSADLALTITLEDQSGVFTLDPPPTLVPGSGSVDLVVRFTPPVVETFAATLDIQSNDPDSARGRRRVLLSGQGMSPRLEVLPGALRLTAVACPPRSSPPAACVDTDLVTVRSSGEVPVTLGEVTIRGRNGAPAPAGIRLQTLDASGATIEPDESLTISVRWSPSSAAEPAQVGEFEAELVIPSNDPRSAETVVPLTLTGLPNSPPTACIAVKSVTRRRFRRLPNPDGTSSVVVDPAFPVPESEYLDPALPGEIQLRPGMTVTLGAGPSCTLDPDDDVMSYVWSMSPAAAGLTLSPQGSPPVTARLSEIIEPGRSTVTLTVGDSVNPPVATGLVLNAIPKDDLFVQVGWPEESAANVDLDLHLVLDSGPGVSGPGDVFCEQDAFVFNPNPRWFEGPECFDEDPATACTETLLNDPRYLLDDTGGGARVESIALAEVPFDSKFRVAVHYFGGLEKPVVPVLRGRLKGVEFGPFSPTETFARIGDVWFGAEITFPPEAPVTVPVTPQPPPSATPLQTRARRFGAGESYDGSVGLCF